MKMKGFDIRIAYSPACEPVKGWEELFPGFPEAWVFGDERHPTFMAAWASAIAEVDRRLTHPITGHIFASRNELDAYQLAGHTDAAQARKLAHYPGKLGQQKQEK